MAESDSHHAPRPRLPPLVPGIYNYCDSRCARCRFSQRCLTHLASERSTRGEPDDDVCEQIIRERDPDWREPPQAWLDLLSDANDRCKEMEADEQVQSALAAYDLAIERARADRLVVAARHYTSAAWNVARALESLVGSRSDPVVIEAVETIGELAGIIASKTFRAISSSFDEHGEVFDLQHDANGSAKVARLAVAESKHAWYALMDAGRAVGDGVPAAMFRVLDELDAGLAARFPRAMEFVRPGFDTEPAP